MKRNLWLWPVLALVLALSPVLAGESFELPVKKVILDNGLILLMLENHDSPTVATYIQFKVGACDERLGITGVSHVLEHMIFKGSDVLGTTDYKAEKPWLDKQDELWKDLRDEKRKGSDADPARIEALEKEFAEAVEKAREFVVEEEMWGKYLSNGGTHLNASTSKESTQYFVSLPANKLELWAWMESDRFVKPVFREFYPELQVVKEERRMRVDDSPDGMMVEMIFATAYSAHPYRWPTIGWMSDLSNLPLEETYDYFFAHYSPNNMVVTLVGDINLEETEALVRRYFERIPRQPDPPPVTTIEPKQNGEKRVTLEANAQPSVLVGYHKTDGMHPDNPVFTVIRNLLSIGRTSRLYQALIDTGLATLVEIDIWPNIERYPTLYLIGIEPKSPHTTEEVEKVLYAELERLATEPISDWEMEKVRNRARADVINTMKSNFGLANQLTRAETLGDWQDFLNRPAQLAAVTKDDIMRVTREYLNAKNRTVITRISKTSKPETSKEEKQ